MSSERTTGPIFFTIPHKNSSGLDETYFIIFFDLETGGFDPTKNGILSICVLHVADPNNPNDADFELYTLLSPPPGTVISPRALEVNGIKEQDLVGQPTFDQFMSQQVFPRLPRGRRILFVGHNSFEFDARWIKHYMEQIYPHMLHEVPDYKTHWYFSDTLDMAKTYNRGDKKTENSKLVEMFGHFFPGETFDAHCALDDTKACGRVFECLKRELNGQYPIKCWSSIGCMTVLTPENVDRLLYS